MSSRNRDSILTSRPSDPYKRITILIVSSAEYTEELKGTLLEDNKQNYESRLQYIFSEHVDQVVSSMALEGNTPDYIAIVMNPKFRTCIDMAEENIKKIDPSYIQTGRLCLVNGSCSVKPTGMGVGLGHINTLSQKYSVILINGDILVPDKCKVLASRISELATTVCGYHTGIPVVVDIPGWDQVFS